LATGESGGGEDGWSFQTKTDARKLFGIGPLLRHGSAEHQTLPQSMCNNGADVLQSIYRQFVAGAGENAFIYRKSIFTPDMKGLVKQDLGR
jgi:hypothetical protein